MLSISPRQASAALETLAFFQTLVRANGPAFEPMLEANWARTGEALGLRGNPQNPGNSLVRHSRLLQATSPSGEFCLGLLLMHQPAYGSGTLYLGPHSRDFRTAFRLEMPSSLSAYRHCSNPLKDDDLLFLTVYLRDDAGLKPRDFVRLKDLWRAHQPLPDQGGVFALTARPETLAPLGALRVTQPFDCSDIRYAPSPWARFVLGNDGVEGAAAAKLLGLEWFAAEEDATIRLPPGSVMSHGPL